MSGQRLLEALSPSASPPTLQGLGSIECSRMFESGPRARPLVRRGKAEAMEGHVQAFVCPSVPARVPLIASQVGVATVQVLTGCHSILDPRVLPRVPGWGPGGAIFPRQ